MRVVVLMSTYQGERYIQEQLASVLTQLPPEGRIVIRDDGSTDETVAKIYGVRDERISLVRGPNVGFVRSFLELLGTAPDDAEMIMLADQDDVWLPHKIERAWNVIGGSADVPTLYCSRLQLVDKQLTPLGLSPNWPQQPSFQNALTENIVTGCTAALNVPAARLARRSGDPNRIYFHDWWMYLVVAAFGRVVFDPEPTVLYRQHGSNVIGMGSGMARYRAMLRFLRKTNWVHVMFEQIQEFGAAHGTQLDAQQQRLLDRYFDPHDGGATVRLLFAPRRFQQSLAGEILFRILVAACVASGRGLLPRRIRTLSGS